MIDPLIGQLVAVRHLRGWTLDELAVRSGVGRTTLVLMESGSRRPTLDVLRRVADALNVDLTVAVRPWQA